MFVEYQPQSAMKRARPPYLNQARYCHIIFTRTTIIIIIPNGRNCANIPRTDINFPQTNSKKHSFTISQLLCIPYGPRIFMEFNAYATCEWQLSQHILCIRVRYSALAESTALSHCSAPPIYVEKINRNNLQLHVKYETWLFIDWWCALTRERANIQGQISCRTTKCHPSPISNGVRSLEVTCHAFRGGYAHMTDEWQYPCNGWQWRPEDGKCQWRMIWRRGHTGTDADGRTGWFISRHGLKKTAPLRRCLCWLKYGMMRVIVEAQQQLLIDVADSTARYC